MPSTISPPESLDQFPGKVIDAYVKRGIPLTEEEKELLVCQWNGFYDGRFIDHEMHAKMFKEHGFPEHSLGYDAWIPMLLTLFDEDGLALKELTPVQKSHLNDRVLRYLVPIMTFDEIFLLSRGNGQYHYRRLRSLYFRDFPVTASHCRQIFAAFDRSEAVEEQCSLMGLLGQRRRRYSKEAIEEINAFHRKNYQKNPQLYFGIDEETEKKVDNMGDIIDPVSDPDLLLTMITQGNATLRRKALTLYDDLVAEDGSALEWKNLYDIARSHPKDFAKAYIYHADNTLLQILWQSADPFIQTKALRMLRSAARPTGSDMSLSDSDTRRITEKLSLLTAWYETDYNALKNAVDKKQDLLRYSSAPILRHYWALGYPKIKKLVCIGLFGALSSAQHDIDYRGDYSFRTDHDIAESQQRILQLKEMMPTVLPECGDTLKDWFGDSDDASQLERILKNIDKTFAPYILNPLQEILVNNKSGGWFTYEKPVKDSVIEYLYTLPARTLLESGWLTSDIQAVQSGAIESIMVSHHGDLKEVLHELCQIKDIRPIARGMFLDRLEELGEDLSGMDPDQGLSLEAWQERVKKGRLKTIPKELRTDDLMALIDPLGERLGRVFITTAAEIKEGRVPRKARHIAQLLGDDAIGKLTQTLVNIWIELGSPVKYGWILNFACEYGDDNYVQIFKGVVNKWFKKGKQKANFTIRALGRLGTPYAVSVLNEIAKSNKYSGSLIANANKSIDLFLRINGLTREELEQELIPDFGMTQGGLVLDLGPRSVTVKIIPELELRVHHETGKVTKTFTKMKKDEDEALYKAARKKFNVLKKNFKPVLNQQLKLMQESLTTAHFYTADRWQRIYHHHPLMSLFFQGVIWTKLSAELSPLDSFRISEDLSLISFDDREVIVAPDDLIGFWHPAISSDDEIREWESHFEDYQLNDALGQLVSRVFALTAEEKNSNQVTRFKDVIISGGALKSFLKSRGFSYEVGDGPRIYTHYRYFPSGVTFNVEHEAVDIYYDEHEQAALYYLAVHVTDQYRHKHRLPKTGEIRLGDLSPVLVSSMVSLMAELAKRKK